MLKRLLKFPDSKLLALAWHKKLESWFEKEPFNSVKLKFNL